MDNITKSFEEALTSEGNLFLKLINAIPDPIFVIDKECRFLINNSAHIKALGAKSLSEVVGKTDYDFRPAALASRYISDCQKVMKNNKPIFDYEEPTMLPSGEAGTLLVSKMPFHNAAGNVIGLIGISRDITECKRAEHELQLYAGNLEKTVERRTQELSAANQQLTAMNEELTAINVEIYAMNESLADTNRMLAAEVEIRQQKEQELLLREKQYRATVNLLTSPVEDVHGLLESILMDAVQLVQAPGGHIGLLDESGKNFVIRHVAGDEKFLYMHSRPADRGMTGEVCRSGEFVLVEDYQHFSDRISAPEYDRLRTSLMVPLKQRDEIKGVLAANWQDEVHPVTQDDVGIFRQFGLLASLALERANASAQIACQNQLMQKLAETTASLGSELNLNKVLQNILDQAISFMGIPHGFIALSGQEGRQAYIQCGSGRYESLIGKTVRLDGKGLIADVLSTGRPMIINDYANWSRRLEGDLFEDITSGMQAPLILDGETIGSIGLTSFGKLTAIDRKKLDVFEQFATVAAIAFKNDLVHQKMHHLAFHDTLTGLPNREQLNRRLEEELKGARCGEVAGAVMFIDLDDLKMVNDHFGHTSGDHVIIEAGKDIVRAVGETAFVARVGGDEFIVIMPDKEDLQRIAQIAERLVGAIRREYRIEGQNIHMTTSIGVALYPDDGVVAEEIMKKADIAMYAAKAAGKNCLRFYEAEMKKDAYEKLVMTNDLRHALERGELYLHYQPMIKLDSYEIIGFEALLRWKSREHGRVPPARFIPLAEQSGLILSIGEWVFGEACRFARKLVDMDRKNVHVAVNVSPRQLADDDFVKIVQRSIKEAGIEPETIEVEITENVLIDSLADSTLKLNELKTQGLWLSLDDFGTGFSSLTYLRNLPVGTLKIDKSFIDRMLEDTVQEGFVGSIIDMAHVLGLRVIAEGVETEQQMLKLAQFGCDCVQGYVFSRPISQKGALHFFDLHKMKNALA